MSPNPFRPWRSPLGNSGVFGISSFSEVREGGIPYSSQCTNVPDGASGSSTISARLTAFDEAPSHSSGGEMFPPFFEYFSGILPPLLNAPLVNLRLIALPMPALSTFVVPHARAELQ